MAQAASYNKKSPTIKRILREAAELANSPSPDYHAAPLESNLFEWHFTLRGPPSSPYERGIYHGRITLPPTYPLRPPSFRFLTPSGRFEANREICLSISDHHEDTWQPAWGVRTAVVALRGFMETEAGGQVGGLTTSAEQRRDTAERSRAWCCDTCAKRNDEILDEARKAAEEAGVSDGAEEEATPEGLSFKVKEQSKEGTPAPAPAEGSTPPPPPPPVPAASTPPRMVPPPPTQPTQLLPPHTPQPQLQFRGAPLPQHALPVHQHATPVQLDGFDVPLPPVETPWLDKIIWAFMAMLIAAVAKRAVG